METEPKATGEPTYALDKRSRLLRLCLIPFLQNTAVVGTIPMVTYKALDAGATPAQIGVIGASFTFLSLLIAIPGGRWVDRWGSPLFMALGSALIVVADVLLILTESLVVLTIGQMILGLGFVLCVIGTQTFIANNGDPAFRDRLFGTYNVTMMAGSLSGPLMVALIAGQLGHGPNVVFAVAASGMLVGFGVALSVWPWDTGRERQVRGDGPVEQVWPAFRRVSRAPTFGQAVTTGVIIAICGDIIVVYLPVFGEENDISVGTVALLLTAMSAASISARTVLMPLLRWLGRPSLLVASMLLTSLALVAIPFTTGAPMLFLLLCLAGFGLGIGPPLTLTWISWCVSRGDLGFAFGIRQSANRSGQMVVTAIIGGLAGFTGPGAVFVTLGVIVGAGMLLARDTPAQEPQH